MTASAYTVMHAIYPRAASRKQSKEKLTFMLKCHQYVAHLGEIGEVSGLQKEVSAINISPGVSAYLGIQENHWHLSRSIVIHGKWVEELSCKVLFELFHIIKIWTQSPPVPSDLCLFGLLPCINISHPRFWSKAKSPKPHKMILIHCSIKLSLFPSNVLVIRVSIYLSFSHQLLQVRTSVMRAHENTFMDHRVYELEEP